MQINITYKAIGPNPIHIIFKLMKKVEEKEVALERKNREL